MNISFVGGDNRNAELAKLFMDEGANVKSYGNRLLPYEQTLEEATKGADIIILGIPALQDKEMIKADLPISITYFLNCVLY